MNRPLLLALSLPLVLAACGRTSSSLPQPTAAGTAVVVTDGVKPAARILEVRNADAAGAIAGQYIVALSESALPHSLSAQGVGAQPALSAQAIATALGLDVQGLEVQQVYTQALSGFAARLSSANLEALRRHPMVKYIEQDGKVSVSATQSSPRNWGLDRLDQRNLPLNGSYTYGPTGRGVTAYIVDSGINTQHVDFGGRAYWGTNTVGDGRNYDCNTHGTHVAGTVGGTSMGVAKNVNLVAVKVLDCSGSGSVSGIVAGLDWVLRDTNAPGRKVINMSINSYDRATYRAYADAINRLANAGVPTVNSAGNQSDDACYHGPADVPAAIVVAASDRYDNRANFSNYGGCVDIFAPGVDILSANANDVGGYIYNSGTSMAAPHVAGVVAQMLEAQPSLTTAQVEQNLISASTKSVISNTAGSPNRLLFLSGGTATAPAPAPTPTVNTYSGYLAAGQSGTIQPNGVRVSGTLTLNLTADADTDFDLFLQRWNGSTWQQVASSENTSSTERITYNAAGELYRAVVYGYSGQGNFTLTSSGGL